MKGKNKIWPLTGLGLKNWRDKESKSGGKRYGVAVAAFFVFSEMASTGFLALPRAISDTGWSGIAVLLIISCAITFSGTRLGLSWIILEERWPQYRAPVRQPYVEIGYRAYGKPGKIITMTALMITLIGSSIVDIILIASFINSLQGELTFCSIVILVVIPLIPITWPGTPKDFWQVSVLAAFAIIIACTITFAQLLSDQPTLPEPRFDSPTFTSYSLAFGTFLFAFGGVPVFPTIQNDMKDKSQFWKSIIIGLIGITSLYIPVAVTAYALLGSDVAQNILLYQGDVLSSAIRVAVVFETINLLGSFPISSNTTNQNFEEIFGIERNLFHYGRQ